MTPVRLGVVTTYSARAQTPYSAVIAPRAQVDLAFKSGGYVERILQVTGSDGRRRHVQEGDWVAEGAVLATVRDSDYTAGVSHARAQLVQARASLEQAKLDFERTDTLYRAESVTKPTFDAARTHLDSAAAGVTGAESALTQAETALADCALKAPMSGWVLKRAVEVGSLVSAATPGFSIADTTLVKAVFGVPDLVVTSVKLGGVQAITTQSLPGDFEGRVTAIAPAADAKTRTFSVEVTIPNARNVLRPGMVAALALSTGQNEPTAIPVVPLSAIVRSPDAAGGFGVFVVEERSGEFVARARAVDLGETYGNLIGVQKGVAAGERVIVSGAEFVRSGQQVRVLQ
jgi:RND family efflux transporter MFP subunit